MMMEEKVKEEQQELERVEGKPQAQAVSQRATPRPLRCFPIINLARMKM